MHSAPPPATPYLDFTRAEWSALRRNAPMTLTTADLERIRGTGDPVDLDEVREIYLPLCRLINVHVGAATGLHAATAHFLGDIPKRTPFVIGVAGSVAVGKSTVARLLRVLLSGWPQHPRVALVTTDGFLLPNAELHRRGLMGRKGFPESYDRAALVEFVAGIKSGADEVSAPVYSHVSYDITDQRVVVGDADIVIVEGLNVLQPPRLSPQGQSLAVSDFFDFSVYVDADADDIGAWYLSRFMHLRATTFTDPAAYFHRYSVLSDSEAEAFARQMWEGINLPNLQDNIEPTRGRATCVLTKGPDHRVRTIRLRRV